MIAQSIAFAAGINWVTASAVGRLAASTPMVRLVRCNMSCEPADDCWRQGGRLKHKRAHHTAA